jgi:hypothetical protein
MELNVWLSSRPTSIKYDDAKKQWDVEIETKEGLRKLKSNHIVIATGFGGDYDGKVTMTDA